MTESGNLRDLRGVPFAQVETELLKDPHITPQCKALYSLLVSYGPDRIFPGQETLADCLGVTRQTINTWLVKLRDLGLIGWDRRGSMSNQYYIYGYVNVKPDIQQMSSLDDIRCKAELTRSISTELDPSNQEESPIGDLPGEEIQKTEETPPRDYLTDVVAIYKRTKGKPSWTIPAEAGGADPYLNGPLMAACAVLRITPEALTEKEQRDYASVIRKIAEGVKDGTPELFIQACQMWSSCGPTWKGKTGPPYSSIRGDGFRDDMQILMRQITSGTIGKGGNGWSRSY
jgi:predicted transcriptional regulator